MLNHHPNHQQAPQPGTHLSPPQPRKRSRQDSTTGDGRANRPKSGTPPKDSKEAPPSILVREKKQKACANCRRAKLKCIVEDGDSDCVRCRARKERCVFYPRGHDEDWQQTLTGDLYTAVSHLSQLSATVHHILDHLVMHGAVPPLPVPLPRYDVPDRDLSILQGWGAERNRALGQGDSNRKRARRSSKRDDEDDDESGSGFAIEHGASMFSSDMGPPSVIRPGDVHLTPATHRASLERASISPTTTTHRQPLPFRSHSVQGPMSTIGLSDDMNFAGYPMQTQVPHSNPMPPGPDNGPSGTVSNGTTHGSTAGPGVSPPGIASISPTDNSALSIIMDHSSATSQRQGPSPLTMPGSAQSEVTPPTHQQQGIFGLLNGTRQNTTSNELGTSTDVSFMNDSLGSADPRPNIVKRGIISNNDALGLVNYFHARLSPWLFGYRLEFTKFPYIPQGPSVITPFILSVMCLVAAERVPDSHEFRPTLAREVTQLLVNSPADSFISTLDGPLGGTTGNKDEDGEEELDPELGIGPEEIVGACILATFMTEREQAATIASSAFKWARGWIKWTSLTVPLPPTLGEVCGLLPVKRDATREDMARVWLLCYIVDGTEALQRDNPPPPRRDPMSYCHVLVPDSPIPGEDYSPHDILLTFHARLITLLRDWYHRRGQADTSGSGGGQARLASSINASLVWWRADLESHNLAPVWLRHLDLFWEFARMLVNATSAKSLSANPRLRAASWAHGVEAAVGFLEKCQAWPSAEDFANLPPCYLSMITLAGSVLVDAIKDQGVAECPFQAEDALPLINNVANMLMSGGLPSAHVSRTTGITLRGYADQLASFL